MTPKEFRVNEFIKVKLEGKETVIYVKAKPIKSLLSEIPINEVKKLYELEPQEEFTEFLQGVNEDFQLEYEESTETRFWIHCNNLKVWWKHNYDPELFYNKIYDPKQFYNNVTFYLLDILTEYGDPIAKKAFANLITKKLEEGQLLYIHPLLDRPRYFRNFNIKEINQIFQNFNYTNLFFSLNLEDSIHIISHIRNLGTTQANDYLTNYVLDRLKNPEDTKKIINLLVHENQLNILSEEYLESLDLKELIIGEREMPEEVGYIKSLEKLSLSGDFYGKRIPDTIGNLINLKELDLGWVNELETLPESVKNLINLRKIVFPSYNFTIPEWFSNLDWVEEIQVNLPVLNNFNLKNYSSVIKNSGKDSPLRSGKIGELICLFSTLINLGIAQAREDLRIFVLNKFKNLKNAEKVINWLIYERQMNILNQNDLESLDLKELKIYNVGDMISWYEIPREIGFLKSLEKLSICGEEYKTLPDSIGNLFNLNILDLEGAYYLKTLPESLKNLKNLKIIIIPSGHWKVGVFFELPEWIDELYWLEELNLEVYIHGDDDSIKFNLKNYMDALDKSELVIFAKTISNYRDFSFSENFLEFFKQKLVALIKKSNKKQIEILLEINQSI